MRGLAGAIPSRRIDGVEVVVATDLSGKENSGFGHLYDEEKVTLHRADRETDEVTSYRPRTMALVGVQEDKMGNTNGRVQKGRASIQGT
jgi:hypothetical protein